MHEYNQLKRQDKIFYPYQKELISQGVVWEETMTGKYNLFLEL